MNDMLVFATKRLTLANRGRSTLVNLRKKRLAGLSRAACRLPNGTLWREW